MVLVTGFLIAYFALGLSRLGFLLFRGTLPMASMLEDLAGVYSNTRAMNYQALVVPLARQMIQSIMNRGQTVPPVKLGGDHGEVELGMAVGIMVLLSHVVEWPIFQAIELFQFWMYGAETFDQLWPNPAENWMGVATGPNQVQWKRKISMPA